MPVRLELLRRAAFVAALTAIVSAGASADPLALRSDADADAFARALKAFARASQVHWVVEAKNHADAEAAIARVALKLSADDQTLLTRVAAKAADPQTDPSVALGPVAWIEATGDPTELPAGCSWRVRVADPAFPSPSAKPAAISLAPGDLAPVSAAATFRIEHFGVLQAKLYAFGETRPGAIRDLAAVPDVNIPVAREAEPETIFLATARQAAPYFEQIKSALAGSNGERRDLGPKFGLTGKAIIATRSIGANIETVPPTMIATKSKKTAQAADSTDAGQAMETCLYTLARTP